MVGEGGREEKQRRDGGEPLRGGWGSKLSHLEEPTHGAGISREGERASQERDMGGLHDRGLLNLLRTHGACWGPESEPPPLRDPLAVQVLSLRPAPQGLL